MLVTHETLVHCSHCITAVDIVKIPVKQSKKFSRWPFGGQQLTKVTVENDLIKWLLIVRLLHIGNGAHSIANMQ